MTHRKFVFVREFRDGNDIIPVGSELTIVGDMLFFNSLPIIPGMYNLFRNLINAEIKNPHYLREETVPYNKC